MPFLTVAVLVAVGWSSGKIIGTRLHEYEKASLITSSQKKSDVGELPFFKTFPSLMAKLPILPF
jgi:hypothetical protein